MRALFVLLVCSVLAQAQSKSILKFTAGSAETPYLFAMEETKKAGLSRLIIAFQNGAGLPKLPLEHYSQAGELAAYLELPTHNATENEYLQKLHRFRRMIFSLSFAEPVMHWSVFAGRPVRFPMWFCRAGWRVRRFGL